METMMQIWNEVRRGKIVPPVGSPRRGTPPTPLEIDLAGLDRVRRVLLLRLIAEHPDIESGFWWNLLAKYEDSTDQLPDEHFSEDLFPVTPEMLAAGEEAVNCEVGGADLGGYFSASDLALRVYQAMVQARTSVR